MGVENGGFHESRRYLGCKKRQRGSNKERSDKKPGGQNGHIGARLNKSECPDEIEIIKINKRTLPKGYYHDVGYEACQVVDIKISRIVTEYRAQILEDDAGRQYVVSFPAHVTKDIQYGPYFKSLRVLFPAACGVKYLDEHIYP